MKTTFAAALFAAISVASSNAGSLIDAVKNHESAAMQGLLKPGANLNSSLNEVEPDGTTALHYAAHWGDLP